MKIRISGILNVLEGSEALEGFCTGRFLTTGLRNVMRVRASGVPNVWKARKVCRFLCGVRYLWYVGKVLRRFGHLRFGMFGRLGKFGGFCVAVGVFGML